MHPCLCGFPWIADGRWSAMQIHLSFISDIAGWQRTYSRSLMNIQFTPASRVRKRRLYTGEKSGISHSLFVPFLYIFPLFSSTSLYMYNQNISSNMQTLISCACFIRGVDQETFFPGTLSKPTQSCTVCAKEKSHLSFVSTHTLIWGFHSWVSSRSPQKPGETQETHLGPSIFPSSAEAQLIPHGLCVFISQQGHT